ncbi:MAG: EamA family transporter [Actinomycetales bacterium]
MDDSTTRGTGRGLLLALVAAASFGTSGTFATALNDIGWTSGAAVLTRIGIAALVLTVPALVQLRRHWPELRARRAGSNRRQLAMVAVYGLLAVAGAQLAFFNAVQRLNVGVALMLEYLGVILVVLYGWLRHGQRPRRLTVAGSAAAVVGLALVLDLPGKHDLDPIGVLWGLCAAVGLATFYLLSAQTDDALPPVTMAWASMVVGAAGLAVAALAGVLPVHVELHDVRLAGQTMSWVVPVLGLSVLAADVSYITAIGAARRLGARLSSFIGLTEVLFAVLFAWAFIGQLPALIQLFGGALIVAGVALVRIDEMRIPATPSTSRDTSPDPSRHPPVADGFDPLPEPRRSRAGAAADL